MSSTYTFSKSGNFTSGLNTTQLQSQILASAISSSTLTAINVTGDVVDIIFVSALSGGDVTILNAVIAAHIPVIIPPTSGSGVYNGTSGTTTTLNYVQTANCIVTIPGFTDTLIGRATTDTLTNKTLTTPIISSILNTGTLTLPTTTDTLIGRTTTDTLINKTLTLPVIASISNTGTLTLPTVTDTLVGRATTDTITNKTLTDNTNNIISRALWVGSGTSSVSTYTATAPTTGQVLTATSGSVAIWQTPTSAPTTFVDTTFTVYDSTDNTRSIKFDAAGTTGTSTTLLGSQTTNKILTLPDITDTIVARTTTDTLTNKTLTAPVISTIVNTGTLTLPTVTTTIVGRTTTDTLTNKTLTAPVIATIVNTGTLTLPTVTTTIVGRTTTDTLTNKTLTLPIISSISNTGTLTLPTTTDTLIGRATTDTLTNKTLTGTTNTIAASQLRSTTTDVVVSAAAAPTIGQVLTATSGTAANWQTPTTALTTFVDTLFTVYDSTDNTKSIKFDAEGATGTNTTLLGSQTINRILTLPDVTDTLITRNTTDTLTNKSLTAPVIATIVNIGTLTLPTTTDTLVGRATTDTLTNKTLTDNTNNIISRSLWVGSGTSSVSTYASAPPITGQVLTAISNTIATWQSPASASTTFVDTTFAVYDSTDNTRSIKFDAAGTSGTNTTLLGSQTSNKILTLPDVTDTLVTRNTTDTLTNKTLTTPVIATIVNTGTLTLPTTTDTLVGRATTDTLINKTLTTPIISTIVNTGTLTLPTTTDTLVGRATTDTLTNKTLTGTSNTISASQLRTTTTDVVVSASTAPTTGQVLTATSGTAATWQTPSSGTVTFVDTTFTIYDSTDNTRSIKFDASGTTGTSTTLLGSQTTNKILTLPDVTDTIVTRNTTDTLTNKTLTTPVIATIVNTGTLTLPSVTTTLVGRTTTDTLTNKTLTLPVISSISNTGTLTLPSTTDTLIGRATTDTLTNKTLTGITNTIAASQLRTATNDVVVSAATAPTTGQVLTATSGTTANWQTPSSTGNSTFVDTTFTIYDSTDNTRSIKFDASGTTGTSTTLLSSQTSNKTLTLPDATDLLVAENTTSTLTNKTLTDSTNNVISRELWVESGASSVSTYAATAPTTGQILTATSSSLATWQTPSGSLPSYIEVSAATTYSVGTATLTAAGTMSGTGTTWTNQMVAAVARFAVYSTGTASQSGTTITGVGTTFTTNMANANGSYYMLFADGSIAILIARVDNTTLTASLSQTVSSQSFTIFFQGYITVFTNTTTMTVSPGPNANITPAQAYSILSFTPNFTTTSISYTTITSMSSTPTAGNYFVEFSGVGSMSVATTNGAYALFNNGLMVPGSRRYFFPASTTARHAMYTCAKVTVISGQSITVRAMTTVGTTTFTVFDRTLLLTPIQ